MFKLLGVLLLSLLSAQAIALSNAIIQSIEIRGNKKIETAAILQKLQSKVKGPRIEKFIEQDIQNIHSLNFFDSIDAYEEEVPGGVKLIFELKERPTITKINYMGNDALDGDDLKDLIQVREFEVLNIQKINESIDKVQQKYEEKGFYLADVHYELATDEKRNEVEVTFHFDENDKIRVKRIQIVGNKMISADELKGIMQTKEDDVISWITGSGSYKEAIFERDMATMGYYYGTKGYVRAKFSKPEVSVSPDKKYIYITFFIDEGLQYKVGTVDFAGDLLFTRAELMEDIKLVQGDIFNTEILRQETLRLTEKYGDLGYAFANVVPQPDIHDDTQTVDIKFEIETGKKSYIGKIFITGNTKTKDKVIRRELRIQEGELFSGTRKRLSRENVLRLGFFDSVEFHQSTSKIDDRFVDIEIRVKERSTGQLVIGAGYASGDIGFTAQAQLSQNNFLGNGQMASLSAQILTGKAFYEFNLGFQEPYVGYSLWSLGGDVYQLRRQVFVPGTNVSTYLETKTGFDIRLGHPILEYTNLYLTYKLENSSVPESTIIDKVVIPASNVNGITSSVTASVIFDHRDDRFDPRNGLYWNISEEAAGIFGTRKFLKTNAGLKFFHPIVWDFIFRLNLTGSNIATLTNEDVPLNELFIMGGLNSIRGYRFLSIGPKVLLSDASSGNLSADALAANLGGQQIVIGGHNQVMMNAEIEFPIFKEAKVRGVVFFDAGNAFDGRITSQNPAIFYNWGWGIRWFTPIGPLRFEFGYPLIGGNEPQFYFTIGPPF